ncbi:hypothetical protein, partial [Salmonella sp. s51228]|uniref:hypothetical protein n=1 Tax=Salmonella sp. s51228 TaxID=3159652 RepID=UPI0039816426
TLHFLHILLQNHPASVFYVHIPQLCPLLVQAVEDAFYKITSEALLVMKQLILVLRPEPNELQDFDFTPYISPIYQAALIRLKAIDIDQEVKDRSISCMCQTLASFGDKI